MCVAREQDKSSPLEVVTAQDPRFQNQVELAVRFGKTLFISEVDTVCHAGGALLMCWCFPVCILSL